MKSVYVLADPGNGEFIGEAEDVDAAISLVEKHGYSAANIGCKRISHQKTDFWLVFPTWQHKGQEN